MAKTIKFNLICDGKPIRTIEDLQNNFSIEDILDYYNSKLLHKWLAVRGYANELEKVNNITANEAIEILKSLIAIFDIKIDSNIINESLFILEYTATRIMFIEDYKRSTNNINTVVSDYIKAFYEQIDCIIENNQNKSLVKASISIILNDYFDLFKMCYRWLFYKLLNEAPLAIFVLLTFEKAREFYIHNCGNAEDAISPIFVEVKINEDEIMTKDYDDIYNRICKLAKNAETYLGSNLLKFSGQTDGYWKDLETNEKKYMILGIGNGDYVRSSNNKGGDLGYAHVLNNFVILDGIDYKSNSERNVITYMEV